MGNLGKLPDTQLQIDLDFPPPREPVELPQFWETAIPEADKSAAFNLRHHFLK